MCGVPLRPTLVHTLSVSLHASLLVSRSIPNSVSAFYSRVLALALYLSLSLYLYLHLFYLSISYLSHSLPRIYAAAVSCRSPQTSAGGRSRITSFRTVRARRKRTASTCACPGRRTWNDQTGRRCTTARRGIRFHWSSSGGRQGTSWARYVRVCVCVLWRVMQYIVCSAYTRVVARERATSMQYI